MFEDQVNFNTQTMLRHKNYLPITQSVHADRGWLLAFVFHFVHLCACVCLNALSYKLSLWGWMTHRRSTKIFLDVSQVFSQSTDNRSNSPVKATTLLTLPKGFLLLLLRDEEASTRFLSLFSLRGNCLGGNRKRFSSDCKLIISPKWVSFYCAVNESDLYTCLRSPCFWISFPFRSPQSAE